MSPLRHDCFIALPVAIIATGFLAEIRWRDFIVDYGMMAHVLASTQPLSQNWSACFAHADF
jgi:hypothetical protein